MTLRQRVLITAILPAVLASPSVTVPVEVADTNGAGKRVDDYLSRLVPYGFSGAVLVAVQGRVVLKKGYGLANRAAGLPYSAEMASCIGSISKQFTAAAILKLEMAGKLRVSDPIAKYLPDVPPDKAAITVHHLLTHTAGLSGDLGGRDDEPITRDALVASVLTAPLAAPPGTRFEYSNEGYSLAGAIVERVSGQGFEQYLHDHVFGPAGMTQTGYVRPGWFAESLPLGYAEDGQVWGRVYKRGWLADGPGWYLRANGGIHSTLDDLYRWHRALDTTAVLSADAVTKFQAGHVSSLGDERYGYGWGVRRTRRGTRLVSHNGGNGFLFADLRRYLDDDVVIVAMTNQGAISATDVAPRQLESLVFADETLSVVMPPVPVEVARDARERLAGSYRMADGSTLTVRATPQGVEAESSDPLALADVAMTPAGGQWAELESRTQTIVKRASSGDFAPLFEAFASDRPFELIQANQRRYWAEWRNDFGAFQNAVPLGTTTVDGDPAVMIQLRFARGGPVLRFVWGPRRLAGWSAMPPAAPISLVAQSADRWVHFSYRRPHLLSLTFQGDAVTLTGAATITGRRL